MRAFSPYRIPLRMVRELRVRGCAAGADQEKIADEYPQYARSVVLRVLRRTPLTEAQRERAWFGMLAGSAEEDLMAELGATRGQIAWVSRFFIPKRYYPWIAAMHKAGLGVTHIAEVLAARNRLLSFTSVEYVSRMIRASDRKGVPRHHYRRREQSSVKREAARTNEVLASADRLFPTDEIPAPLPPPRVVKADDPILVEKAPVPEPQPAPVLLPMRHLSAQVIQPPLPCFQENKPRY